jgi:hypothetical protein
MKTEEPDYYRMASEFYQFNSLPEDYLKTPDEKYRELLQANACVPFEGYDGDVIDEYIQRLSVGMQNIARAERRRVLAEVNQILNQDQ